MYERRFLEKEIEIWQNLKICGSVRQQIAVTYITPTKGIKKERFPRGRSSKIYRRIGSAPFAEQQGNPFVLLDN
jgi:hypothetical protein